MPARSDTRINRKPAVEHDSRRSNARRGYAARAARRRAASC